MPTYEYKCGACKHQFEQFQSMRDKSLRKCPACGKNSLERLIGIGAAVLFKGSGFYQTDYRSESYKRSAEADKKSASPESPSSSTSGTDTPTKPTSSANADQAPTTSNSASVSSVESASSGDKPKQRSAAAGNKLQTPKKKPKP